MKEKVLIGLLCNNLNPVSFYKINEDLPINLVKFTVKGISWTDKKIRGIILRNSEWQKAVTRFPDVVYNRCYTNSVAITSRLEKVIGKGKVFNSFTRFNKYTIYSILEQSKLKHLMIPTYPYNVNVLLDMLNQEGSVLIKPMEGSLGSNIYRFTLEGNEYNVHVQTFCPMKSFKMADEFIRYIQKDVSMKNYIIQPFISFASVDGHIFDMRMLVQKNHNGLWDVTADISRMSYKNYFVTNTAYAVKSVNKVLEGTAFEKTIIPKLRAISIKIANILENNLCSLGEISVDFGIASNGKPWIIEVNGKPEKSIFGEIDNETLEKVFITPLQYAAYLAKA